MGLDSARSLIFRKRKKHDAKNTHQKKQNEKQKKTQVDTINKKTHISHTLPKK